MVLMVRTTVIDTREFARFIFTGVTATVGNIAAVGLARFFVSFEIALGAGIVAGFALSFTLSKFFAFRSRRRSVIRRRSCGTSRLENKASIRQQKNFGQP